MSYVFAMGLSPSIATARSGMDTAKGTSTEAVPSALLSQYNPCELIAFLSSIWTSYRSRLVFLQQLRTYSL